MNRRVLIDRDADVVSVSVSAEVQRAIERATEAAYDSLVTELAPFGLSPLDIVIPEFEQVIYEDEVPIFTRLQDEHFARPLEDWERDFLLPATLGS